jgi:hypothetical protein
MTYVYHSTIITLNFTESKIRPRKNAGWNYERGMECNNNNNSKKISKNLDEIHIFLKNSYRFTVEVLQVITQNGLKPQEMNHGHMRN